VGTNVPDPPDLAVVATISNSLSNELVKNAIEQFRIQSFTEVVKGNMRRSVEEVEPT
jgi:hypothetical protein